MVSFESVRNLSSQPHRATCVTLESFRFTLLLIEKGSIYKIYFLFKSGATNVHRVSHLVSPAIGVTLCYKFLLGISISTIKRHVSCLDII